MASPPEDILGILLKTRGKLGDDDEAGAHLISDNLIAQTIMQFFMDGYGAVAQFIQFAFYFLACNPEVQSSAVEEIEDFSERHGGDVNRDTVDELVYLEQVLLESARLTTFPLATRTCTKPWKVPGTDLTLPVGTRVLCNFGGCQLDEDYFHDPGTNERGLIPDFFSPISNVSVGRRKFLVGGAAGWWGDCYPSWPC